MDGSTTGILTNSSCAFSCLRLESLGMALNGLEDGSWGKSSKDKSTLERALPVWSRSRDGRLRLGAAPQAAPKV